MQKGYQVRGKIVNGMAGAVMVLLVVLAWGVGRVQGAGQPASDAEKMKEMREMFSSQYQEEDYYRADRLLLTATGSFKPLYKAPSVATVITAEDIERMGATTLNEALETVPGLHVGYGSYGLPTWSIRGIHAYTTNPQTLLLINGIPVVYTYMGSRPNMLRHLVPVAMISRIEVIRGPGSAVYGADAFSGVVNVITKDANEVDGTQVGVRYGSFHSHDVRLQHGGTYRGWNLALSLENQRTRGDDGRIVERDRLFGNPATLAPGPLDSDLEVLDTHLDLRKERWTMRFWGLWGDGGAGQGVANALTYGNDFDDVFLLGELLYKNSDLRPDWDLGLRLHGIYMHEDVFLQYYPANHPTPMLGNPIVTERNSGLEATSVYTGFDRHQFRFAVGMGFFDSDTEQHKNFDLLPGPPWINMRGLAEVVNPDDKFMVDQNRHLYYGLFQDEWSLARHWELTAGVRYDRYSDFGSTTNPRAALVWEMRPDLTTKLLYGQAFRAPSFGEQYVQNNPVAISNPDLQPEEIETLELAFDYQPKDNLRTIFNLFAYEIEGLIEFTGPPPAGASPTAKQAINSKDQDGYGFELEVDWQVTDSFQLKSNFTRQRARDKNTRELVPDFPGMQFYANGHWEFQPDWSLDASYNWVGDRKRNDLDIRPEIADYDLVGLTLRRKNIKGHWDAALAIKNLFDSDAREPSPYDSGAASGAYIPFDYPLGGRSLYCEVRYSF